MIWLGFFLFGSWNLAQVKPMIIKKIAPDLYVYQTFNSYKGVYYAANALFLITDKGVVLFDVPWQKSQYGELIEIFKKKFQKKLIAVFVTHSHEDRAGDLSYYNKKKIPTYASAQTNALLMKEGKATATQIISLGQTYTIGNKSFIPEYFGKGHTSDNIVIWFPKEKILDGGCLIKSSSAKDLGNLEDADLKAWPETLHRILKTHPDATMIIPGHDEWQTKGHIEHSLELLEK